MIVKIDQTAAAVRYFDIGFTLHIYPCSYRNIGDRLWLYVTAAPNIGHPMFQGQKDKRYYMC